MSLYDSFVQGVRDQSLYGNVTFKVYTGSDGSEMQLKNPYIITDGGLHRYRACQPPCKWTVDYFPAKRAKRLESVRKDVECLFGTMKTRFSILGWSFHVQG